MPGFVPADDLPALYAVADAFVMPSLEEGFGMTVVEAMAAGTPVVGTRVGGIPALVDDGETGELVPSGDASALAAGIERLLDRLDASGAEPMARAARRRADDYAWDRIGAQFESVYEEVVA
jgi:glycosyltransferase involved in cell wall biosynthesis